MNLRSLTSLSLLTFSMLAGCVPPGPQPPIQPLQVVQTPAAAAEELPVLVRLIDAASGELLGARAEVTVTGSQNASQTSENGIVQLSGETGASLNLVVRAPGYYPTSLPLRLRASDNVYEIRLVSLQAGLKGFAHGETSLAAGSDGRTGAALELSAENAADQVFTRISLPAGTQLKDAAGQALSGELQVQIGSFGQQDENQASFPGGLNATGMVNGQAENGFFAPAAYASVELSDAGGRQAASFDQPMQISTRLPGSLLNPKTGQPIQAGESLEIWSYDTRAGQWRSEGQVTLPQPDAQGNFALGYAVSHLSYWYLGWRYGHASVCNAHLRFVWAQGSQKPYPIEVRLKLPSQSFGATNVLYDELNTIFDVPRFSNLLVVAYSSGAEIGRTTTNLEHCSSSDELRLDVDTRRIPRLVNVSFTTRTGISWPFIYRNVTRMNDLNYYQWRSGFMYNGKVTLALLEGDTYEFKAVAGNQFLSYKLAITPGMTSFNLDAINPLFPPGPALTPLAKPQPSVLPVSTLGQEVTLFDTSNRDAVKNGPVAPARLSLSRPHTISRIFSYHWNSGQGTATVGQHSLVDSRTGKIYGPWQALGSAGQNGTRNANWQSAPNAVIPAGDYVLVDSDPLSWSYNILSQGQGMGRVSGIPTP
ncbi:MAG: hypothetical protein ACAI44_28770 [Candidatus Sericytochromatia bacterium]